MPHNHWMLNSLGICEANQKDHIYKLTCIGIFKPVCPCGFPQIQELGADFSRVPKG